MKIVAVCGNGLGSSLMIEINIKKILREKNIKAEVTHIDLSNASTIKADIYIMGKDISKSCSLNNKIVLESLIDKTELENKLINKIQSMQNKDE
jgi:ascorbate PTS system EIIB component